MKLKFIGKVQMTSNGRTFAFDTVHDIADDLAERLLTAFPTKFERIETPQPIADKPKTKPRARKPKED